MLGSESIALADTCFPPEEALESLGPYDMSRSSQHFAVYFNINAGQQVDESRVEELLFWLEESLEIMTTELGFSPPELIDEYQLLVAVEHLPSPNTGAFTNWSACGASGQMAYMVLNSQWFADDQKLQSLAPHELFHAIQMRYAFDVFWGEEDSPNRWWLEASAAYMERVVYPQLDKRQQAHALQWTREPWRALRSNDSSGFQYGAWLLAASIEQSLSDGRWHRQLWDGFLGRNNLDVLDDLDGVLAAEGSSFATEYGRFIERAATMDFEFGVGLTTPEELWEDGEGGLIASHAPAELPLDAIILATNSPPAPQTLGTNYVQVHAPDSPQALRIDIEAHLDASGNSRGFELRLVAVQSGEAGLSHRLNLESTPGSGSEAASIILDSFGGTYESLIIAASPTLEAVDGSNGSWSYSLSLTEWQGGVGFIAAEMGANAGSGCASCSQVSMGLLATPPQFPIALLMLGLLSTRRRVRKRPRL